MIKYTADKDPLSLVLKILTLTYQKDSNIDDVIG